MSAADRLAALKARVNAAVSGSKGTSSGDNRNNSHTFDNHAANRTSGLPPAGGLNVPLHPALEDLSSFTSKSTSKPTFKRTSKPKTNPYIDPHATTPARPARQLHFNAKGKYIQQGNALRRQAALEAMKKRIAEQARRAGIDDVPSDKNFVVEKPPDIEWVDQGYFGEGKAYGDLEEEGALLLGGDDNDSLITNLIQHPIPIAPPQDKLAPAPKPMYLTKLEQKKIRRARRTAEMKERQAKIRLGLMPAPPPKVKKSNLMRVLGEEAVQDPTAVEARVNREIEARFQTHLQTNEARKLTREQRHAKLQRNQDGDAAKGIHLLVFRVGSLANGQHRFKVWKNAEQLALTGVCILHPRANLVVVEGGVHSITKYRKLMMQRIDWTQNVPSTYVEEDQTSSNPRNQNERSEASKKKGPARPWLANESDTLPQNECRLLFDGEAKMRAFHKWSSKICDTDREAYDFLARTKMESFWTQARA